MLKEVVKLELRYLSINEFKKEKNRIKELQKNAYKSSFEVNEDMLSILVEERNASLERNLATGNCYLVGAYHENGIIGFVWFFEYKYLSECRMHVNQIVVDTIYRKQGVGGMLYRSVEEKSKRLNIQYIDLNVSEGNDNAVEMYIKYGFLTERRLMKKYLNSDIGES